MLCYYLSLDKKNGTACISLYGIFETLLEYVCYKGKIARIRLLQRNSISKYKQFGITEREGTCKLIYPVKIF